MSNHQFPKNFYWGAATSAHQGEGNNFNDIREKVIPVFRKFHFLSAKKKRDFAKFCQAVEMKEKGKHLYYEGIKEILELRREMNDGGKRKFTEKEILQVFQKSSETIRQIPIKDGNDIVRACEKSQVILLKKDEPG